MTTKIRRRSIRGVTPTARGRGGKTAIRFGSQEAQKIVEFDRNVRLLDKELRKLPCDFQPYILASEVADCIYYLAESEDEQALLNRAWRRLLKTERWILFQYGAKSKDNRYQPADEEDEP